MSREINVNGRPVIEYDLACPECGAQMRLKPSRYGLFYGCSEWPETKCNGTHGAHMDGSPLGTPANQETKEARIRAHKQFDKLWKSGQLTRDEAYLWLQENMNLSSNEAHIGGFDKDQCKRLLELLECKAANQ